MVQLNTYPSNVATPDLFRKLPLGSDDEQFKEGQKLEAVDPLEMSRICPATIGKVRVSETDAWSLMPLSRS
jgi:hypothetical protein